MARASAGPVSTRGRRPRRGEIWWCDLADAGRRPVLILTRNAAIDHLTNVTIAPLTRTVRGIETEVELTPAEHGVPTRCVVSLDNVTTIPKASLERRIRSALDADTLNAVVEALRHALELDW